MAVTSSPPDVLMALRDRAITYVPQAPLAGTTLGALLGSLTAGLSGPDGTYPAGTVRFFQHAAPDGLPFSSIAAQSPQFFALGVMGQPRALLDGGDTMVFPWEVTIYGRPRAAFAAALRMGAVLDQAYLRWVHPTGRLSIEPGPGAAPLPVVQGVEGVDAEVVAVRGVYAVRCVPEYLTALAASV